MASTPKLRMDRSRPYGSVHGERAPGDAHQNVHFYQDNLPFDAQGFLVYDAITDENAKKLADRKLKKLVVKPADEDGDDGADEADASSSSSDAAPAASGTSGDVNLDAWLRGEANYQWAKITKTVRERYHQNISKQADMVAFLVLDEKIIPENEVAPDLLALLPKAG
jgi:hypothetical protein